MNPSAVERQAGIGQPWRGRGAGRPEHLIERNHLAALDQHTP